MQDVIDQYVNYLKFEQGCSENTISAYRGDLAQFLARIAPDHGSDFDPNLLSEEQCTEYLEWLSDRGYRPSTIHRKVATLRSFLEFLRTRGEIVSRSIREKTVFAPSEREIPEVLSREEVTKLIHFPNTVDSPLAKRDHSILSLMYTAGLRASDLIELRIIDFDLEHGDLVHQGRKIPMDEALGPIKTYLLEGRPHLIRNPHETSMFLNQRGKGLTRQGLWLIVKKWSKISGIEGEISPHTLRHSLVLHLLQDGWPVKKVQNRLGMKSPNSIRIFKSQKSTERED
jgi:integrase/recombinase XerD